jgi:hypothetical protein
MANRPNQFKHRDIVRAFRAAEAAGVPNPSVRFQCPNGTTITIDSNKPDKVAAVLSKPAKVRQPAARGRA